VSFKTRMTAAHFHDTPYIHLGGAIPPRRARPLGPRADALDEIIYICIPLFSNI